MIRRTFGAIKGELARVCGATGMNTSDERVMGYTNMATEELMNEYDFASVVDRLVFNVTSGHITLPSSYDRIMMMNLNCIPMQMQSPWFEFVATGWELLNEIPADDNFFDSLGVLSGVLDRDQVCQFEDVPTDAEYYIRVYGQAGHDERTASVRPKIVIQGYDADGKWIRTQNSSSIWIDGIEVEINGDAVPYFISTTQTIKQITAIVKPATSGYVYVYATPVLGGDPVFIAAYAPKDTNPYYRKYFIKGLCNNDDTFQVVARCRRRYMPVLTDADQLIISNLPALKAMVMAIFYFESNEPDNYLKYKATAVDILKKEMKAYLGLQTGSKPVITFGEGMGVRRDGNYIL